MRILAVYRHYWPDATPYARLLKSILERAAAAGHDVTVHTAQPSYNDLAAPLEPWRETVGAVAVRRVRLLRERKQRLAARAVNSLYFLLRAVAHAVFGPRYDVIIANVHPPVLAGLALWAINRLAGTPYVLHVQDIHPESLRAVGKMRDGVAYRLARRLDTLVCRRAARLVTLSADMADALVERGVDRRRIEIINNSPLPVAERAAEPPPWWEEQDARPTLLFAGNLGDFQALDLLVAAARQLAPRRKFRLVLMGAGAARLRLMEAAGEELDRTIYFLPHASPEVAIAAMRRCDFGIVSLAAGMFRFAYPSKSMTYLSAGCPLVAVVEPQSELGRTVRARQLGYVAGDHSVEAIVRVIEQACDERDHWTPERRRGLATTCEELFGERRMLEAWGRVLAEVAGRSAPGADPRAAAA